MKKILFTSIILLAGLMQLTAQTGSSGVSQSFTMDTKNPEITLTNPNGGDSINYLQLLEVGWAATDDSFGVTPISAGMSIEEGGAIIWLAEGIENSGSTEIDPPDIATFFAKAYVKVVDAFGNEAMDESDGFFIVTDSCALVAIGDDVFICHDQILTLNAHAANFTTVLWTTNGTGTFENNSSLETIYYPGVEDIATCEVEICFAAFAAEPCEGASDCMMIHIQGDPIAFAGYDITNCSLDGYYFEFATATNYSGIQWSTNGNGFFDNIFIINPAYYPDVSDIGNAIEMVMQVLPIDPCTSFAVDSMELSFIPTPMVHAGDDKTILAGEIVTLSGTVENSNEFEWWTSGDGYFIDFQSLNTVYNPGVGDIAQGVVYIGLIGGLPDCYTDDWLMITILDGINAEFMADPLLGNAPLSVQFTDLSTGTITSWAWDFDNDGVTDSQEQNPEWVYSEPGTYTVSLEIFDGGPVKRNYSIETKTDYIIVMTGLPAITLTPPSLDFGTLETHPTEIETLELIVKNTGTGLLVLDSMYGLEEPFSLDEGVKGLEISPGDFLLLSVTLNRNSPIGEYFDTLFIANNTHSNTKIDLNEGLVAYYPFNGNANDESGNGNNGTVYGATLTTDRFGNENSAYDFDGDNDWINTNSTMINGAFTMAAWIKTTQESPNYADNLGTILSTTYYHGGYGSGFILLHYGPSVGFSKFPEGYGYGCYKGVEANINNDEWHFLLGTWDGTTNQNSANLFIDGQMVSSSNALSTSIFHNFNMRIGYCNDGPYDFYHDGKIDDIRIYNRALSEAEIQALYYEGTGNAGSMAQVEVHAELIGGLPALTLTPPSLDFGTLETHPTEIETLELTVKNTGTGVLVLDSLYGLEEPFVLDEGVKGLEISSGDSLLLPVTLNRNFPIGEYFDTLFIANNTHSNTKIDLYEGLVAYYPFNGNAYDESGNGNNGTVYGATLTEDRFGHVHSAYSFNGISNSIEIADNNALDFTTSFSLSLWINQTNTYFSGYRILDKITAENNDGFGFDTYGFGSGRMMRLLGVSNATANSDYTLYNWHHLVVTVTNNTASFYLDGIFDGSGLYNTIPPNTLSLLIGAPHFSPYSVFFSGKIDDIRIYNRALSEAEIQVLYDEGTGNAGSVAQVEVHAELIGGDPQLTLTPPSLDFGTLETHPTEIETLELTVKNTGSGVLVLDSLFGLEEPFSLETPLTGFGTLSGVEISPGDSLLLPVTLNRNFPVFDYRDTLFISNNTAPAMNLDSGLVAYYPFNGNANDESGNGNNGTVNGATLSEDRFGNVESAYSFDGNSSFISINQSTTLDNLVDELTMSYWVKKSSSNLYGLVLMKRGYPAEGQTVHFCSFIKESDIDFQYSGLNAPSPFYDVTKTVNNPSSALNDNEWHLITMTHKFGSRVKSDIYIDASKWADDSSGWYANVFPYPAVPTPSSLIIGKQSIASAPENYNGILDDIRIYNRALSEAEIQALYYEGTGNAGSVAQVEVHAELIGGLPALTLTPPTIDFGTLETHPTEVETLELTVKNTGTGVLVLDSLFGLEEPFALDEGVKGLEISPGDSLLLPVTLNRNFPVFDYRDTLFISNNTAPAMNLDSGLVAYYPFNGNANDESGNGNNGTPMNSFSFVEGVEGQAIRLQGSGYVSSEGGHVLIPPQNFSNMSQLSISMWVNEEGMSHDHGNSYLFFGDASLEEVCIAHYTTGLQFTAGEASVSIPFNTVFLNNWKHYLFTFDDGILKAYLDSEMIGVDTGLVNITNNYAAFGRSWWWSGSGTSTRFIGSIDEARIYNRALSEAEIQALFNEGSKSSGSVAQVAVHATLTNPIVSLNADFEASQTSVIQGEIIQFTDLSSGNPTTWQWDFDYDGTIDSQEQSPQWTYDAPGIYTVLLTVSDGTETDTEIKLDFISVEGAGTVKIYDHPDFILHVSPEESSINFGSQKIFGNFNADNYQDFVVLAPRYKNSNNQMLGKAYLYYGTAEGIDTSSVVEIEGIHPIVINSYDYYGLSSITTGDFNNDGYDDLALGCPWYQAEYSTARGYVMVILSNADGSGLNLGSYIEFVGYSSYGTFGYFVNSGDVNGDSIDDLIVSAIYDNPWGAGNIYIYYGSNSFDTTYDKQLLSSGSTALYCGSVGDINGDGFDDVVGIDIPGWNVVNPRLFIFMGGTSMNSTPTYVKSTAPYRLMNIAGDVNSDGFDDILLFHYTNPQSSGNIKIIKGASNFDINNELITQLSGTYSFVSSIANIDGDFKNEVFVSVLDGSYETFVFKCNTENYINTQDTLIKFLDTEPSYGFNISDVLPGDMNGDNEFEFYGKSQMTPYNNCVFIYNHSASQFFADFSGSPLTISTGDLVQFTDLSTGNPTSWQWDFDNDGIIDSQVQNPQWTFDAPGVYTVSLTVSDGIETDTETKANYITVLSSLDADFTVNTTYVYQGEMIEFFELSMGNPTSWQWDFESDGIIDSYEQNPFYSTMNIGYLTVSLTVSDGINTDTETKVDYIYVDQFYVPVDADFYVEQTLVELGTSVQFYDLSIGPPWYWAWDFDNDGNIDSYDQHPQWVYQNPGIYTVTLTAENMNGPDTETKVDYITVFSPLVADFTATPTTVAVGETIQFTDLSTGYITQWNWDFESDGIIDSQEQNPVWAYSEPGFYTVSLFIYNAENLTNVIKENYIQVLDGEPQLTITPTALDFGTFEIHPTEIETLELTVKNTGTGVLVLDSLFGLEEPFELDEGVKGLEVLPGDSLLLPVTLNRNFPVFDYRDTLFISNNTAPTMNLDSGLVAYYPFNGNSNDESGNGNNGTVYGATLTEDRFGNMNSAYSFDGNNYINIGSNVVTPNQLSISAWIRKEGNFLGFQDILTGDCGTPIFAIYNSDLTFGGQCNNPMIRIVSSTQISDTEWHQVNVTYNGNTKNLYIDGLIKGSDLRTGNFNPNLPLRIGASISQLSLEGFIGKIDDLRIYNRALSEAEIQALYNEGTGNAGSVAQVEVHAELIGGDPQLTLTPPSLDFGTLETHPTEIETLELTVKNTGTGVLVLDSLFGLEEPFSLETPLTGFGTLSGLEISPGDSLLLPVTLNRNFPVDDYRDTLFISNNTASTMNLDSGLVAYYPFNGNANDESGNGNNGTPMGSYSYLSGVNDLAVRIQSGGHILIPFQNFNNMSEFSISIWVYEEGMSNSDGESYIWFGDHNYGYVGISHFATSIVFGAGSSGSSTPFKSNFLNNWKNYSMVYNSGILTSYEDGNEIGVDTGVINLSIFKAAIGKHWWANGAGSSTRLIGRIDETRIYNRALSEAEIQALFNEGSKSSGSVAQVAVHATLTNPIVLLNADYEASQTSLIYGETIQFTDLSTGNPTSWQWDFDNDGNIDSQEQNPQWAYDTPGVYTVSLTVSDGIETDTETKANYITVYNQHVVILKEGWSGLSSYLNPLNGNIEELLAPVLDNLIIIQNLDGVYWPGGSVNTIGNFEFDKGYQIKVINECELSFNGLPTENQTIQLSQGWNLIPVLSDSELDIAGLFGENMNKVQIIKESVGTRLYWPEMNISTITTLVPGNSYFVKTTEGFNLNFGITPGFSCGDILVDPRDGQEYNTVQIGNQCWMAENLAYLPEVSPASQGSNANPFHYVYGYQGTNLLEAKATTNYIHYGALYNWPASLNACPDGWHLPSDMEWIGLTDYLSSQPEYLCNGFTYYIAKALASAYYWHVTSSTCAVGNNYSTNNATGFSGLPGGLRGTGSFNNLGDVVFWWSSNENSTTDAWYRSMLYYSGGVSRSTNPKSYGFSVRCMRDETTTSQLIVTPPNQDVTFDAGTATFEVTSNTSWTVTENETWFSVSPMNGNNNGTLTVTYDENLATVSRIGQITITATGGAPVVYVTVTQAGFVPTLTVTPINQDVTASGGTTTFEVTSNTSWTVSESVSWLSVDPLGGIINGTLTVSYDANLVSEARIGQITITAAGGTPFVNVTVTQAGMVPTLTVTPTNQDVSEIAGTTTFEAISNTAWTVTDSDSWLSVDPLGGINNGTLTVSYDANLVTEARTGQITITAAGGTPVVNVTVTQAAFVPTLTVTPTNQGVSSDAGTTTFEVSSNTTWTVLENADWITVTPTNGNLNQTLTVNYDANTTPLTRIGEITITAQGGNPVLVITVTQQEGQQAWACGQPLIDNRDGQTYNTVQIGTQCWMAQNLNIGTRIDGTNNQTNNELIEKYCYLNQTSCGYGGLYQWNEMMDYSTSPSIQGICPFGWHLPSDNEWTILSNHLGHEGIAGGKMKSTGTIEAGTGLWRDPNTGATNSSGLTSLPGGCRNANGFFSELRYYCYFWSSSPSDTGTAFNRRLNYNSEQLSRTYLDKSSGYSVRCLRD